MIHLLYHISLRSRPDQSIFQRIPSKLRTRSLRHWQHIYSFFMSRAIIRLQHSNQLEISAPVLIRDFNSRICHKIHPRLNRPRNSTKSLLLHINQIRLVFWIDRLLRLRSHCLNHLFILNFTRLRVIFTSFVQNRLLHLSIIVYLRFFFNFLDFIENLRVLLGILTLLGPFDELEIVLVSFLSFTEVSQLLRGSELFPWRAFATDLFGFGFGDFWG